MTWLRILRLASTLPPALSTNHVPAALAEPEHHGRRRRRHRKRRCRKRRKWMGILALVVAFLAGKCCGMKKRGCGCSCSCKKSCCGCRGD